MPLPPDSRMWSFVGPPLYVVTGSDAASSKVTGDATGAIAAGPPAGPGPAGPMPVAWPP